ncbi:hypothetical protein H4219_004045 [Mycoemilia scoparia]|uniref:AMP-dependent synthetase/ligase domain-containing protein n=1 Tax=Mycoemilia scoparia TaxID=417184 RepID=A0A9W8DRS1_9FUNG|nr:hypothetical protein H4219_004045 [Mycoemilia scoparia]
MIFHSHLPKITGPQSTSTYHPTPVVDIATFLFDKAENTKFGADPNTLVVLDSLNDKGFTYSQLKKRASQVASGLQNKLGVKRDDIVGVFLPNTASIRTSSLQGAIYAPTFSEGPEGIIPYRLKQLTPKVIVTDSSIYPRIRRGLNTISKSATVNGKSIKENESPSHNPVWKIVIVDDKIPEYQPELDDSEEENYLFKNYLLKDILCDSDFDRLHITSLDEQKNTIAMISHSSGSTGPPKPIAIPHYAFVSRVVHRLALIPPHVDSSTGIVDDGAMIAGFPLSYTYCIISTAIEQLARGAISIIGTELNVANYLRYIEKYQVNHMRCSPSLLSLFLHIKHLLADYDLNSLKYASCAGSTIDPEVRDMVEELLGISVLNDYGSSEIFYVSHDVIPMNKRVPYSAGMLVPTCIAKIVNQDGKQVGPNELGEICVKSDIRFMGYYNDPELTNKSFDQDGFYKMGDIGSITEDGQVVLYERKKYTIHYLSKHYVFPCIIESRLWKHPEVEDAIVMPHFSPELNTEVARAFIVLSNSEIHKYPPSRKYRKGENGLNGNGVAKHVNNGVVTLSDKEAMAKEQSKLDEIIEWVNEQAKFEGEKILGPVVSIPRPYFPPFSKGRRFEILVTYIDNDPKNVVNMDKWKDAPEFKEILKACDRSGNINVDA